MLAKSYLLSVPTRGQVFWGTVTRMEEIHAHYKLESAIMYVCKPLSVTQCRNFIVNRFLAGGWDVLVMVDDDIVPPPHLLHLFKDMDDYGMLAVPHPMPTPDGKALTLSVLQQVEGGKYTMVPVEMGVHEADAVATGCVAITREALLAFDGLPFRISHDPDDRITTEDLLFCEDLRDLGFKVGYTFDGWFCDHYRPIHMAPLLESSMLAARAAMEVTA